MYPSPRNVARCAQSHVTARSIVVESDWSFHIMGFQKGFTLFCMGAIQGSETVDKNAKKWTGAALRACV